MKQITTYSGTGKYLTISKALTDSLQIETAQTNEKQLKYIFVLTFETSFVCNIKSNFI